MITGCNTNVLYRGKQIIASEKSSYAHRIDADELDIKVRAQIELQHKAMLKRLVGGELDAVIDERLGGGVVPAKPAPAPAAKKPAAKKPVAQSKPSTGETSGSVTANAATDPSIDSERPAADTKPIIDDPVAAAFGNSADSEKPLDEVILEYLVDKARDRASDKKRPPARQPRQKG